MSRNQREGRYYGKWRRRHRRGLLCGHGMPYETRDRDWKATRLEMRQHKLNQSFIRRLGAKIATKETP